MSLNDVIAVSKEAQEHGLSYGKYVSLFFNPEGPTEAPPVSRRKRHKRRYTDEQAFALWQEGKSDRMIADACGVSRQCIQKWRDQLELPCHTGSTINTQKYRLVFLQDGTAVIVQFDEL